MQIDPAFQQFGIARDIQVDRLEERTDVRERSTLRARLGSFKAVTDFHSGNGKKANATAKGLVIIVIAEVVEFECASPAGREDVKVRSVGNIERIIRTGGTDGNSATHLEAERSFRQDAVVNSQRAVGQFIDPKDRKSVV